MLIIFFVILGATLARVYAGMASKYRSVAKRNRKRVHVFRTDMAEEKRRENVRMEWAKRLREEVKQAEDQKKEKG